LNLDEIRTEIKALQSAIQKLKNQEYELLCHKHEIRRGDRVRHRLYNYEAVVHHVADFDANPKPWIVGYRIRRNGNISYHPTKLYSEWEKINDGIPSHP
jgi:hypothetical protein